MCRPEVKKSDDVNTTMPSTAAGARAPPPPPPAALTRREKIDLLNERVVKITARAVQDARETGRPLDREFVHAQRSMTTWTAGSPVYQLRSAPLVYLYGVGAVALIVRGLRTVHHPLLTTLSCLVTVFVGYDFYSGVLHVVLDHPENIGVPVLGQPCLEFQWHHAIPDDIVRKDFRDVCGDLNVVVGLLIAVNLYLLDLRCGVSMLVGGLKLLMAYYGQFSHRSAHAVGTARHGLSTWLQRRGWMISVKDHMAHHRPPHDVDFCLIGLCNPVIDAMRRVTTDRVAWLVLFLLWSVFDLCGYVRLVQEFTTRVLQISTSS